MTPPADKVLVGWTIVFCLVLRTQTASALPLGESPVQIEIIALGGERVKLSDLAVARMYCGGIYST